MCDVFICLFVFHAHTHEISMKLSLFFPLCDVRWNDCQGKSFFLTPFVNSICFQTECKSRWSQRKGNLFSFGMSNCECALDKREKKRERETCVLCAQSLCDTQKTINSLRDGLWFYSRLFSGLSAAEWNTMCSSYSSPNSYAKLNLCKPYLF